MFLHSAVQGAQSLACRQPRSQNSMSIQTWPWSLRRCWLCAESNFSLLLSELASPLALVTALAIVRTMLGCWASRQMTASSGCPSTSWELLEFSMI